MTSGGSRYSVPCSAEPLVMGKSAGLRGVDWLSESEDPDDPNIFLVTDGEDGPPTATLGIDEGGAVETAKIGEGTATAGTSEVGTLVNFVGRRPEDRDRAMAARTSSLSVLAHASEEVGTIGDAAPPEVFGFRRLAGLSDWREDRLSGRLLGATEASWVDWPGGLGKPAEVDG